MILDSYGREYYAMTITTVPATTPTQWEASFDGGSTWITAIVHPTTATASAWLVRGVNAAAGTSVATITTSLAPKVRLTSSPELVVRGAPTIQLT